MIYQKQSKVRRISKIRASLEIGLRKFEIDVSYTKVCGGIMYSLFETAVLFDCISELACWPVVILDGFHWWSSLQAK